MEELIIAALAPRTEERREALLGLSRAVSDSDVGSDLFQIYPMVEEFDSYTDALLEVEGLILKLTDEVMVRLGISFSYDFINTEPDAVLALLKLLDEIEEYEDIDGLMAIVSSEEEHQVILHNIMYYIYPDCDHDYYGGIEHIEPRFMNAIIDNVVGRKRDSDNEEYYAERGRRLLKFLSDKENEDLPFYTVFESYMSFNKPELMVEAFPYDTRTTDLTKEDIIKLTVGVLIGTLDNEQQAYSATSTVVDAIDSEEIITISDYSEIHEKMLKYFGTETDDGPY